MPNWLQRIAKGQMELNNETPNSAVIDTVMSDDKNKDEAVKTAIQRDSEIDKRNAGILAGAMSSMFPVLDFSKYGFLKGLAKVGMETATGAAGGYLGNKGGKYLDNKLGTNFLQGIGSFAGGLAGYRGLASSPAYRVKYELPLLTKQVFGEGSKEGIASKTPVKWRWKRLQDYDKSGEDFYKDGVIYTSLFSNRPTLAHEYGHHIQHNIRDNHNRILGVYYPDYKYSQNASYEANLAEAYADWFRTKLGFPYRGKNPDIIARQKVIDSSEPHFLYTVAEEEPLYEKPLKIDRKIIADINTGKQDALNFLSSTVKKETDVRNKALAERLGYKIVQTPERAKISMKGTSPTFMSGRRIGSEKDGLYVTNKIPNSNADGVTFIIPDSPAWDEMYITTKGNPKYTTFHEYLHRGDIGGSANGEKLDTKTFFNWKAKKILNPELYDKLTYLNQPGETAANILEIGKALNIPIGAKYPGKQSVYNIIETALSKNDPKLNLLQYYNWQTKPKRVWEGLTGRYFALPILVGGAYESKN